MPEREMEQYSNPIAPAGGAHNISDDMEDDSHPLTNDDFRKMMMTPRVSSRSSSAHSKPSFPEPEPTTDAGMARKEKKKYYARLKKIEDEKQKELADKYRDRASERRKGGDEFEQPELISTTADYRAVAPDAKMGENYAERRKQVIQESKYLGGDMEHTHLVKGLDYALLEKVRAEISSKEMEDEALEEAVSTASKEEKPPPPPVDEFMTFNTKMGRNIFRTLFKPKAHERNELFLPGRMAYVFDLEEDYADTDVPTTSIRSKADCPSLEATTTLSTNDIVINKLTQILSYLRQGRRDKKKKKDKGVKLKDEEKPKEKLQGADDAIYGDTGDYEPSSYSKSKDKDRERGRDRRDRDRDRERDRGHDRRDRDRDRDRGRDRRDRDRDREKDKSRKEKRSYFEKPVDEDHDDRDLGSQSANDLVRSINEKYSKSWAQPDMKTEEERPKKRDDEQVKKLKKKVEIDSYAECYPGMMESADAIDDSDEEADYTKMDLGNKKGPVGRWDFETSEEYSSYMSNKEALPKAAFQYGVKMADGRKTRRAGPKDQKAALDREWQKIQNLMQKRKQMGDGSSDRKKAKY